MLLKRIAQFKIANEEEDFSLEQVTSDTFLFSATIVSIVSCLFNFLEGFDPVLSLFTVFSSFVLFFLYYLSRFRNYYNIWLSATTVLLLLSVSWFMNGGAIGSVTFMYVCTLMILNFIANPGQQNKLFLTVLFNLVVLYILEYFWGGKLVHAYPDKNIYYFDIIFVFIIILFCVFFSTRYIKRSYEKERNLVKEKTKELELSNEKRTNVFINLAHETKTPLTLITNYLEDYMEKNGGKESEELKLLKKTIDNLTKDILNFFDMEKIQKGISMYDHQQTSDFSSILVNNVKLFQIFAAKKNIEITSDISENLFVKADPNAIVRIINNLIENAVKYTPAGGKIRIILTCKHNELSFSVEDTGIGIPAHQHAKIFEPYFQINSQKANFQGIGLGLSIIKNIINELGGSVHVISDPDKNGGTTIRVNLLRCDKAAMDLVNIPDQMPVYAKIETVSIREQALDENKFTILVVEDDIALLNYMVRALQQNYNVNYATSGEEALEKLKKIEQLDLVISDLMMDKGDGFFLYQNILLSKKVSHVPFIFLTAKYSDEDRMKGLSLGAIDYISKPVSINELDKKIDSLLNNLVNQRNAVINQAYKMLSKRSDEEVVIVEKENPVSCFERNCSKYNISPREIDVIKLMIDGKINKEIAVLLHVSVDTVKKHLQNAYEKTAVSNKFELLKKLTS